MNVEKASFQGIVGWLVRLGRFDLSVFDDVRDDEAATVPAVGVAMLASFLAGLGSWLWWVFQDGDYKGEVFLKSFLFGGFLQVLVWFLWVYVTYSFLARSFGAVGSFRQLVRTMGLAFAPMALSFLVFISVLTVPFGVIAVGGALLLSNVAVQRVSSARLEQVTLANFTGFSVFAIIMGILGNVAEVRFGGGLAPGIFFFVLD